MKNHRVINPKTCFSVKVKNQCYGIKIQKVCFFYLSINNDEKLLAGRGGEAALCAQTELLAHMSSNITRHITSPRSRPSDRKQFRI